MCIHINDSLHCTAGNNVTLKNDYNTIKKREKKQIGDPGAMMLHSQSREPIFDS